LSLTYALFPSIKEAVQDNTHRKSFFISRIANPQNAMIGSILNALGRIIAIPIAPARDTAPMPLKRNRLSANMRLRIVTPLARGYAQNARTFPSHHAQMKFARS
jgi:flagellar biosynthesis/type III secretory pathway ATPase